MFAWGISPPEAAVLCVLAVLLFGRKLPEIASSVGRSLRVFQDSWRGVEDDVADLGFPLPRGANGHGEVRHRLANSQDQESQR